MSESELGQALVACDTTAGADARQTIERVLARDRVRVRRLAIWTLGLWLLIVLGVFFMVWFYFVFLQPKLWHKQADQNSYEMKVWLMVSTWAAWSVAAFAVMMLLAAGSTVMLVFATRRATLGQVNVQLAQISEQLRQMQEALAKPPPGASGG